MGDGCVVWADVSPNTGAWEDIDICAVATALMSEQTYYVNSKKIKVLDVIESQQDYYVNSKRVKVYPVCQSIVSEQTYCGNGKKLKVIQVV